MLNRICEIARGVTILPTAPGDARCDSTLQERGKPTKAAAAVCSDSCTGL